MVLPPSPVAHAHFVQRLSAAPSGCVDSLMFRYICIDFGYLSVIVSSAGPVGFFFSLSSAGPTAAPARIYTAHPRPKAPPPALPVTAAPRRSGSPTAPTSIGARVQPLAPRGPTLDTGRPAEARVRLTLAPTGPAEALHSSRPLFVTLGGGNNTV